MVSSDPPNKNSLTQKQAKILELIERVIAQTGRPPTYRDLAKEAGYSAVGTVQDHVKALIRKGFLTAGGGLSRAIQPSYQSGALSIPILGSVPAGRPIEAIEEIQGTLSVTAAQVPVRALHQVYALKVVGESMIEAGILPGDLVIVRKHAEVRNGDVVVAMIDGEATVKYLERKEGRVRLLPANPKFNPIEIPPESQNSIEGKVIGLHRYY
jgi:repressor LexA